MSRISRLVILVSLVVLVFALPATALAYKQIFYARLTTGAELHQVVGSSAAGNATVITGPDATRFGITIRNLSGPPSGVHIHAPATPIQNAPVLITLCGAPPPAAIATCSYDSGTLSIQGEITSSLLAQSGVTGAQFMQYLNDGLAYINVHTALNPAGEVRGQIVPQ